VVAPDGRYDTSSPGDLPGLSWVLPEDPMKPYPVEVFMRDYYEPRLLPRLLNGDAAAFQPIRPLGELNRVQPEVKILGVRRGATSDFVEVDVAVSAKEDATQKNGKTRTDAYDLRLFRDGQLVGQWPEPKSGTEGAEELEVWRAASRVPMAKDATKTTHTFPVRLASRDPGQAVKFTAYAFNEDRVKSGTAEDDSYKVPADIPRRQPRAYVLTVGVDSYDEPKRKLDFAVKDAQALAVALSHLKDYEVVKVSLLSGTAAQPQVTQDGASPGLPVNQATKANIRAILELLAGKGEAERERLKGLVGVDREAIEQLKKATPDDAVILAFSGHGYTEPNGRFYLLPSDSGTAKAIHEDLPKFISSEELTEWLREVDAGELAMVIDACHSAASVETPGFKPGPMGDRGLGQLAYDKGMRILAATQANDVAIESKKLGQGLLTYALVQDGLSLKDTRTRQADLDKNGEITLAEWLQYGEKRVPGLYEDIQAGKVELVSRDPSIDPGWKDQVVRQAQTPSLFDFHRKDYSIVLSGL
jgi:uncharacterized caspase-like protein